MTSMSKGSYRYRGEQARETSETFDHLGREVLPLIEGGKGISVSNGQSSGAWAAAGGVGTFSGVNADFYDENRPSDPGSLQRQDAQRPATKN